MLNKLTCYIREIKPRLHVIPIMYNYKYGKYKFTPLKLNSLTSSITHTQGTFKYNYEAKFWEVYMNGFNNAHNLIVKCEVTQDKLTGICEMYGSKEKIESRGSLVDGVRNGVWEFYNKYGEVDSKVEYNDGISHGKYEVYYRKDVIKKSGQMYDNQQIGLWHEFYETGTLKSISDYSVDDMYYTYTSFYPDGSKHELFNFRKRYMSSKAQFGPAKIYHANGKQKMIGNYENGCKNGEFEYYDETGKLILMESYRNDALISKIKI